MRKTYRYYKLGDNPQVDYPPAHRHSTASVWSVHISNVRIFPGSLLCPTGEQFRVLCASVKITFNYTNSLFKLVSGLVFLVKGFGLESFPFVCSVSLWPTTPHQPSTAEPLVSPSPFLYFVRITLSFRPQITHQYVLVCIHLSSCVASSHVTSEPAVIIDLPAAVARKSWELKGPKTEQKGARK